MKKSIIIIFIFLLTIGSFAQNKRDRIKALKIAFITEKLELTSEEAETFWPIYNNFESQRESLRKQMATKRRGLDFENLTEKEAKEIVKEIIAHEEQKTAIETKFLNKLIGVLPSKKIIMLKVAEDKFKRRMLDELRKRRRD